MAAVLRCPECGHRHPLDQVSDKETFRCEGCSRPLKVPKSLHSDPPARDDIVPGASRRPGVAPPPVATKPSSQLPPLHADAPEAQLAPLGRIWRLLIWLVAFPLGALVAAVVARAFGLVTLGQLEDVALEEGWTRIKPLLRLLPLWAGFTALFVTVAVVGIEAMRRRRAEASVYRHDTPTARGDEARPSERAAADSRGPVPVVTARGDADTEETEAMKASGTPNGTSGSDDSDGDDPTDVATREIPRT